ncbi:MAG: transglutaminase-like cysteine peptidase [Syntrophales bacterium]|jgi:predicted transglutaminase-like cysteine proteinase|nr:transglutaminase-like cysteine peptidase [Syntrophales bacterium]
MGQAKVISGGASGLYDVQIVKHAGASAARLVSIAARLTALATRIVTATSAVDSAETDLGVAQSALDALILQPESPTKSEQLISARKAVLDKQRILTTKRGDLSTLNYERASLIRDQTLIAVAMATEIRTGVWCTDLTEDLAVGTTVGTMEMNGVDDQIILAAGGSVSKSVGLLQHAGVSTPSAVFLNKVLLPCWQKWKPTYRVGTILTIDSALDQCDVAIAQQYSEEQGLPINQAGIECVITKDAVLGWEDYINEDPTFELATNTDDTDLEMSEQLKADLARINAEVNSRFKYKLDIEQYGELENWTQMAEGGSGDCEDFALTKAQKLLDLGYAASAIHIEVGVAPNGKGHAWLVIQTSEGDLALDNNYQEVMNNNVTPYTNRRRQTGMIWSVPGVKLLAVPVEYMTCNSSAFIVGDEVVVEFTGQNWLTPKVIGFTKNPRACCTMLADFKQLDPLNLVNDEPDFGGDYNLGYGDKCYVMHCDDLVEIGAMGVDIPSNIISYSVPKSIPALPPATPRESWYVGIHGWSYTLVNQYFVWVRVPSGHQARNKEYRLIMDIEIQSGTVLESVNLNIWNGAYDEDNWWRPPVALPKTRGWMYAGGVPDGGIKYTKVGFSMGVQRITYDFTCVGELRIKLQSYDSRFYWKIYSILPKI